MATTTQAVPRVKQEVVTVRVIEATEEDQVYELAQEFQKLLRLATLADTTANALKARLMNQMKREGMDGHTGGIRGLLGQTDAARTAEKAVQPLRTIAAELENVVRNAHVFRNRTQSLVFDAIREFLRSKSGDGSGIKVNK